MVLALPIAVFGAEPTGYYKSCENKGGSALLSALQSVIGSYNNVGYDGLYDLYETSDVWYRGCKWRCIKDCPTGAPRYDSMEWFMIEGNPDFTISIEVENGGMLDYDWFAAHGTDLVVTGQIHNQDVTADILNTDVSWTRRSKDAEGNWRVSDDEAWNALLRKGKTLHLTVDDISYNSSGLPQMLEFTATALLRDGVTAQDTISVM